MEIKVDTDNVKVTELGRNQYVIRAGAARIFQSYNSIIAIKENGLTLLDKDYWDYSRTTSKYRNMFLDECTKETQRKINNGIYFLTKLNID